MVKPNSIKDDHGNVFQKSRENVKVSPSTGRNGSVLLALMKQPNIESLEVSGRASLFWSSTQIMVSYLETRIYTGL